MSYKNNMPNISDSDLEKIAARQNVKGEEEYALLETAKEAARVRSTKTGRIIYIDYHLTEHKFIVHAHGIPRKDTELRYRFKKGAPIV